MIGSLLHSLVLPTAILLVLLFAGLAYIWWKYAPIVGRVFEETPVFAPLRVAPEPEEEVRFQTADGFELAGTYLHTGRSRRLGVVLFCPEYLGDRWSALSYGAGLRERGFDLFTFDFRNHGGSDADPDYEPLQWVSDLELVDLRAAVSYLRSRPDADPAGLALFGVSRGGGSALCITAEDPAIWAVATDGAFPTKGTMLAYVIRWAEIFLPRRGLARAIPRVIYAFAGWAGRVSSQRRLGRVYPSLERAVSRIAPRPWFMIHGERDVYIGPEIATELYQHAAAPKEAWIVPGAKHNRCREADEASYQERVTRFFLRNAPRRARTEEPVRGGRGGVLAVEAVSARAKAVPAVARVSS